MPLRQIRRKIGSIDFSANDKRSLELPRDYGLAGLWMEMAGTLTVGVADADALYAASPYSLLKRFEVAIDGKDVIHAVPGYYYRHLAKLAHGCVPSMTTPLLTQAAHPFRFSVPVPFVRTRGANPLDTLLYAPRYGTIYAHATFGDGDDLVDPAATTTTAVSACTLTLWAMELANVPDDILQDYTRTIWHRWDEITVTATTTRLQHRLPVGNTYRAFHILATKDAGTGAGPGPSSAIINSIRLRRGAEVLFEMDADVIAEMNKLAYRLESWEDGWYVLDREVLGLRETGLDTALYTDLYLEFDVTSSGSTDTIEIFPEEIVTTDPYLQ